MARAEGAAGNVIATDRRAFVTLDNGIVAVDVDKQSGNVRGLRYAGKAMLERQGYFN